MITCGIDIQLEFLELLKTDKIDNEQDILDLASGYIGDLNSIGELISMYSDKQKQLIEYLQSVGINNITAGRVPERTLSVSNVESNFSTFNVDSLFNTLHVARSYFKSSTNKLISTAQYIGDLKSTNFTRSNKELNTNINNLKNNLFETIVSYLISKRVKIPETEEEIKKSDYYQEIINDGKSTFIFTKNLFDSFGEFNSDVYKSEYKKIIKLLETELLGKSGEHAITINSGERQIPNLEGFINVPIDRIKFDVYNAAVLLLNFDTIILTEFKDVLGLNKSAFNTFESPVDGNKYFKKVKGLVTEFWNADESLASDGVDKIQDKLSQKLISIIPFINKEGEFSGRYFESIDITGFGTLIHELQLTNMREFSNISDWDILENNPIKMLNWYLTEITEASKNKWFSKLQTSSGVNSDKYKSFKHKMDVVRSLTAFLKSIDLKEKNATTFSFSRIVTQMMINSIGAGYSTDNSNNHKKTYLEMHTHNSERVQLQEGIYSYLKSNITTFQNLDIPENKLKEILTKSPVKGIKSLIPKLTGITINEEAARTLFSEWTKEGQTDEVNVKNLIGAFINIRKNLFSEYEDGVAQFNSSLFEVIQKNEENVEELNYENAQTINDVLTSLSGLKEIQDILDVALETRIIRMISTVKKFGGDSIPTAIIPSVGQNDSSILMERIKIEKDGSQNRKYNNYFTNQGGLLGTTIKLEVIGKNSTKDAAMLNVLENFISHFEYDFIESIKEAKTPSVNIIIGNYSDKNRVINKKIDKFAKWGTGFITAKNPNDTGLVLTPNEVWSVSKIQSKNYYDDLTSTIFTSYEELIPGINKIQDPSEKIKKINSKLAKFTYDDFLKFVYKSKINFTEELHYSIYQDKDAKGKVIKDINGEPIKIVRLNQTIFDYYKIYNNDEIFEAFKENQKESFIHKLLDTRDNQNILFESFIIDKINLKNENTFKEILKSLGVNTKDYFHQFVDVDKNHLIYKVINDKVVLNPLLDKWLVINEFFRNEYLYISVKPEYMHLAKKFYRENNDLSTSDFLEAFNSESGTRLSGMAKRNVSYTGTTELPSRNSRFGVPDNVNHATIEDINIKLFNIAGDYNGQDIHDGSSYLTYAYSKMIANSYQGKDYNGTKKQLGTFVTEFGSALKKDAETTISNYHIRNSRTAPIKMRYKQEQMYNLPIQIDKYYSGTLTSDNRFFKDGEYYSIEKYSIINNQLTLSLFKYNPISENWEPQQESSPVQVNRLFDIWEQFGGEYSVNNDLKFDESSQELLFKLITDYSVEGNYPLKDAMIHIISNHSSMKSGGTNIHPESFWTNNSPVKYMTFRNRNMGVQLSAEHEIINSRAKEVTQMLSALSQNPDTAVKANEIYGTLSDIIEQTAEHSYGVVMETSKSIDIKKLYEKLSKQLVKNIAASSNKGLAKVISETFEKGTLLPFSNQHFFRDFVRMLIVNMNKDFITRYYPGVGAVLNGSHKIFQIYQNKEGETFTQEDIANLAIEDYKKNSINYTLNSSTDQIIDIYLQNNFPNEENVPIENIQLGDSILVNSIILNIDDLKIYYQLKESLKGQLVTQVYNIARDLKPIEHTFDVEQQEKINDFDYINTIQRKNLFDLDPVRLKFTLISNVNVSEKDKALLKKFQDYIGTTDRLITLKKLNIWTQRATQVLSQGKALKTITLETNLTDYFGNDKLTSVVFDDYKSHYLQDSISSPILNYKKRAAELILGNIYQDTFDTGKDSISKIRQEGANYFRTKIEQIYSYNPTIKVDFKVVTNSGENDVYVKFVEKGKLPIENSHKISGNTSTENSNRFRIGNTGEVLYQIPKDTTLQITDKGYDILYIEADGFEQDIRKNPSRKLPYDNKVVKQEVNTFIKSFNSEIKGIIPTMNNLINVNTDNYEDLNRFTYNLFKRYSGYINNSNNIIYPNFLSQNLNDILNQVSNKKFISWNKSLDFISSRIPAQSMQSFMEMHNVGYFNTDSNDAYVSIWQLFIQGSKQNVPIK